MIKMSFQNLQYWLICIATALATTEIWVWDFFFSGRKKEYLKKYIIFSSWNFEAFFLIIKRRTGSTTKLGVFIESFLCIFNFLKLAQKFVSHLQLPHFGIFNNTVNSKKRTWSTKPLCLLIICKVLSMSNEWNHGDMVTLKIFMIFPDQ